MFFSIISTMRMHESSWSMLLYLLWGCMHPRFNNQTTGVFSSCKFVWEVRILMRGNSDQNSTRFYPLKKILIGVYRAWKITSNFITKSKNIKNCNSKIAFNNKLNNLWFYSDLKIILLELLLFWVTGPCHSSMAKYREIMKIWAKLGWRAKEGFKLDDVL